MGEAPQVTESDSEAISVRIISTLLIRLFLIQVDLQLTSGDSRKHVWSATMLEVFDEFRADPDDVLAELEEAAAREALNLGVSFCY